MDTLDKKTSLYIDTSVFGGYYDDVFERDTRFLFSKIKENEYDVFISDLTISELKNAPQNVKNLLKDIEYRFVEATQECKDLAEKYINEKVVGATSRDDCLHIATATINNVDILVSWNFKHIVNVERAKGYNFINFQNGLGQLVICSPKDAVLYG